MPRLTSRFADMQSFYRFHFLDDGYPGRAEPDGSVFAHPIYGSYILGDYLRQYEASPSAELEEGIRKVAAAALARMSEFHGSLVFWYDADPVRGARLYEKHYSGLTQGYYAVELMRAAKALDDHVLRDAAEKVFASLTVPAEHGGVFFDGHHGPTVAEVPQRPNSWILNGWQSSLASIARYADLSGDEGARELFHESARTMGELLPLYDDAELKISRYGLTGYTYLRLRFDDIPERLEDWRLIVPGEADVAVMPSGATRWQTYVLPGDMEGRRPLKKLVRANVVVSLASAPEPNLTRFTVTTSSAGRVVLEGTRGRYDPRNTAPVDLEWTELGSRELDAGTSTLEMPVERPFVAAAVYPTNFVKVVDGMNVNVYHGVHVRRLRELHAKTGIPALADWADRWAGYIDAWPGMEMYRGLAMRDFKTGAVTPLERWPGSTIAEP